MGLNKKKYDFIDSFRGIAILLVLLTHFIYIYPPGQMHMKPGVMRFLDFGARGVLLFKTKYNHNHKSFLLSYCNCDHDFSFYNK